jgi:hypothetical protein
MYRGLVEPNCFLCGDFGPFFSILKGERVYFSCVFTDLSLRLLFRSVAEHYFGIPGTNTNLRELRTPIIKAPSNGKCLQKSPTFVSFEEAREEAVKIHGSEKKMHDFVFDIQTNNFGTCKRNRPYMLKSTKEEDGSLERRIYGRMEKMFSGQFKTCCS